MCKYVGWNLGEKMTRKIGYARVSTKEQKLDMQIDALKKEGCDLIFQEKISGLKSDRPEFKKCMEELKHGDILIVYNIDRIGRSFMDLIKIIYGLHDKGILFKSLNDPLFDLTNASGQLGLNIIASVKAYEVKITQERSAHGVQAAKLKGIKFGRRKKNYDHPDIITAVSYYNNSNLPKTRVALNLGICRKTLYNRLNRAMEERVDG